MNNELTDFEKIKDYEYHGPDGNVQCPNCGDSGEDEYAELWVHKSGKGNPVTYCPQCRYDNLG